ncbi:hypothetical protein [Oligoflexus tunisiensis]|uniref:hypothetical protein n=1 Tax=Oligoflexus tunisiensis TaxID=708132 RepID=UPI00114C9E8B|nr:hypothetical protein [Oligoflexus tunisiensis]
MTRKWLADDLSTRRREILANWEKVVRIDVDSARVQSRLTLLDRLNLALDPHSPVTKPCDESVLCVFHGTPRANLRAV